MPTRGDQAGREILSLPIRAPRVAAVFVRASATGAASWSSSSIRLLRQLKYLVGFIVGPAWIGLWVVRPLLRSKLHFESAPGNLFGTDVFPAPHHLAALFVTVALRAAFEAGVVLASLFGGRLCYALTGQASKLVLLPRAGEFMGVDTGVATVLLFASFLPMAAAVSFFSSALQNPATLLVPAWMAHSAARSQGVEAFGQRMLSSAALGLALLLALIPGALLVGAAAGVQWWLGIPWSAWAFPVWGVLAAAPLLASGWGIVQAAGGLWDRLDPSQEILELGC